MKRILESTIPTSSFGNVRLKYDDVAKDEQKEVLDEIMGLYNTYGETRMKKREGNFVKVRTFTGENIFYDDVNHLYKDENGNALISASTYKKKFEKPFNLEMIADKTARKYGVDVNVIKDMWERNGKISRTFGNAIHYAMQQYWLHKDDGCDGKLYHIPKHPILQKAVLSFPEKEFKNVKPEIFVSSVKEKMVGQIDANKIIDEDKKVCELWDYKTDAKLDKVKLKLHYIQLSFYAHILQQFGWTVNSIVVWNFLDGEWVKYKTEPKSIEELEESLKK